jgi:hypothetical protein
MKILSIVLRVLLILLLLMPIGGVLGFFPEPTADMYTTPEAWAFMSALMSTGYMMPLMVVVFVACAILMIIGRTALAAILLAPITVNIVAFHIFLDATPISANSSMAYVFLALNAFFLWENRKKYKALW